MEECFSVQAIEPAATKLCQSLAIKNHDRDMEPINDRLSTSLAKRSALAFHQQNCVTK